MSKYRVAILFGGYSAEHDVSIMSAKSIGNAIDLSRFQVEFIGFDKQNRPHIFKSINTEKSVELFDSVAPVDMTEITNHLMNHIDVVFPIIHGPGGEDGKLQGYLDTIGVAYVGAGVMGSGICMDKRLAKEVLAHNDFKQAPFISLTESEFKENTADVLNRIDSTLEFPVFVKPSNLGSSIGISKVKSNNELPSALATAFKYDYRILIEQGINARELECAVYGNRNPIAMSVGEIIPSHEMYDYEAKYSDDCLSDMVIPANAPAHVIDTIKELAVKAYCVLGVEGLARVDFLVDKDTLEVYLNELNTLPGFTKYSMYPLLCKHAGLEYSQLITTLIELALERSAYERDYTAR